MGYQLPTSKLVSFRISEASTVSDISSYLHETDSQGIPVSITSSLDHRPSSFLTVFRASRLVRNRWGLMSSPEVSHKWIWDNIRIYQKIPYIYIYLYLQKNIISYHTSMISNHVKGLQPLPFTNYHLWWPYKAQWNGDAQESFLQQNDWLMDFASDSNLFNFGALGSLKKLNPLLKHIHVQVQSVITHTGKTAKFKILGTKNHKLRLLVLDGCISSSLLLIQSHTDSALSPNQTPSRCMASGLDED